MIRNKAQQSDLDQLRKLISSGCEAEIISEDGNVKQIVLSRGPTKVFTINFETYGGGVYKLANDPKPDLWIVTAFLSGEEIRREFKQEAKAIEYFNLIYDNPTFENVTKTKISGTGTDLIEF